MAFISHVSRYRPRMDMKRVATGEAWLASQTVEQRLGLVDVISTSDEYLRTLSRTHLVITISKRKAQSSTLKKLLDMVSVTVERLRAVVMGSSAAAAAGGVLATAAQVPLTAAAAAADTLPADADE